MATETTRSNDAESNDAEPSVDEPNDDASARRDRNRRILMRGGAIAALVCVVAVGSVFVAGRFPGDSMDIAWKTPGIKASDRGDGDWMDHMGDEDWLVGDTLVQSRLNAAAGFDAGSGKEVWEYRPPGNAKICAAAADVEQSVMVVTRDDENRPASDKGQLCTTLAAVDMKNGRELWRTAVPAAPPRDGRPIDSDHRPVTAGGGLAVLAHQGLRAIDIRTGTPRWAVPAPTDCIPTQAMPAVRHVGVLLACGGKEKEQGRTIPRDAELHAAAFNPATGAILWSNPLGDREPATWGPGSGSAKVISADPLVVSDPKAHYSFGKDGRPNPTIAFGNSHHVVDGNRLYVLGGHYVKKVGRRDSAIAFDLATGQQVWKTDLDADVSVLHVQDGRLTAIGERFDFGVFPAVNLFLLDAATGEKRDVRRFHFRKTPSGEAFAYKDLLIVGSTAYKRA